jgi:putative ABC transport system ATP-binding protein
VVQNVTLPYLMYRSDDGVEARALELLDSLGVKHLADAYPRELSGGEMRRMAIARALVCDPAVVLADEPTSDLDDENTQVVLQKLRDVANGGAAVLVATHDQAALSFADRVLRMDAGVLMDA